MPSQSDQLQFSALERRITALEEQVKRQAEQLHSLERIEVSAESGGGEATYSQDNVVLTIRRLE